MKMTATEKLCRANRWRIRDGSLASEAVWHGAFLVPINGWVWHVMIEETADWRHLSAVDAADLYRLPDYVVMHRLRELFFDDEAIVIQFCSLGQSHLWEYMDAFPTPPAPGKHA